LQLIWTIVMVAFLATFFIYSLTDPLAREQFASRQSALEQCLLKPESVAVLQTMLDEGQTKALDDEASGIEVQP
jgi:hypothetical protein